MKETERFAPFAHFAHVEKVCIHGNGLYSVLHIWKRVFVHMETVCTVCKHDDGVDL